MEEVIEEIKRIEEAAELRIAEARKKASEIALDADREETALRTNYELKLKGSVSLAVASAKEKVNELRASEAQKSEKLREELFASATSKLPVCADYVFEYIVGKIAK